jgi:hypothetical protein
VKVTTTVAPKQWRRRNDRTKTTGARNLKKQKTITSAAAISTPLITSKSTTCVYKQSNMSVIVASMPSTSSNRVGPVFVGEGPRCETPPRTKRRGLRRRFPALKSTR